MFGFWIWEKFGWKSWLNETLSFPIWFYIFYIFNICLTHMVKESSSLNNGWLSKHMYQHNSIFYIFSFLYFFFVIYSSVSVVHFLLKCIFQSHINFLYICDVQNFHLFLHLMSSFYKIISHNIKINVLKKNINYCKKT